MLYIHIHIIICSYTRSQKSERTNERVEVRERARRMALMLSVNMVDIIAYFTSLQLCR